MELLFSILIEWVATQVCVLVKIDPTLHLTLVHSVVCKIYLNKVDLKKKEPVFSYRSQQYSRIISKYLFKEEFCRHLSVL